MAEGWGAIASCYRTAANVAFKAWCVDVTAKEEDQ